MRPATALALLALALLARPTWAAAPEKASPPPPLPPADPRSLREADLALARAVAERDPETFAALVEEQAFFSGSRRVLDGRSAVTAAWAPFFAEGGPRLDWTPELAELSRSGDVGYTIGRSSYVEAPGAAPREGRYVTVWRRAADGRFRVAIDLTLRPPDPAAPAELTRAPRRTVVSREKDLEATAGTFTTAGAGGDGAYLSIRRRGPDGALATALESIVFFPPPK